MARQKGVKSKQEKSKEVVTKPVNCKQKTVVDNNENLKLDPEIAEWIQNGCLSSTEAGEVNTDSLLDLTNLPNFQSYIISFLLFYLRHI